MCGCGAIPLLPDGISGLSSLKELNLSRCSALRALPEGLRGLSQLEALNLCRCTALAALPDKLGVCLPALRMVDLSGCDALASFPTWPPSFRLRGAFLVGVRGGVGLGVGVFGGGGGGGGFRKRAGVPFKGCAPFGCERSLPSSK